MNTKNQIFCLHLESVGATKELVRICLSRKFEQGDNLRSVASIIEAEEIIKTQKPKFIILNGPSAFEFLGKLRSGVYGQEMINIPTIAFTAHAMRGDREKFLEAGFDVYLAMPANMEQIVNAVKEAMSSAN